MSLIRHRCLELGLLYHVHLDLLYPCDLDCQHCYIDEKAQPQATTAELIDVLEQAAELGALTLLLSGGEVFLRKDFYQVLEAARRLHYRVTVKTHGGHVTPEAARELARQKVREVHVSIYALDPAVHDDFTGVPGSLERSLRAVDLLVEAGVKVTVNCTVSTRNIHHYRELQEHFDRRGIRARVSPRVFHTLSASLSKYPLNIPYEDKVRLRIRSMERENWKPDPSTRARPVTEDKGCFAGRDSLYVSPDLAVFGCTISTQPLGDLRSQRLVEIWRGGTRKETVEHRHVGKEDICSPCAARGFCSFCYAISHAATGDAQKPTELVCQEAFAGLDAAERFLEGEGVRPHEHARSSERKRKGHFPIVTSLVPSSPTARALELPGCCGG